MLTLLEEREGPGVRARVARCDCAPGCDDALLLLAPPQRDLWFATALSGVPGCVEAAEGMCDGAADAEAILQSAVGFGSPWQRITRRDVAMRSMAAWAYAPSWFWSFSVERLLELRRVTFGQDAVRVIAAAQALREHWEPDADRPVPAGVLRRFVEVRDRG